MNGTQRLRELSRWVATLSITYRVALYLVAVGVIIVTYTLLYWVGMNTLEGRERSLVESLQTVAQSLTTTGYGQDAPWESVAMNLFTILMQITGILFIFLVLPLFVVPWLNHLFRRRQLDAVEPLTDHIVVSGTSALVRAFAAEMEHHTAAPEYLIIETDGEQAAALHDDGYAVIHGNPESASVLEKASLPDARGAVVPGDDELVLDVSLALCEVAPSVPVTVTLTDPTQAQYLRLVGVDHIVHPRQVIGQALATQYSRTAHDPTASLVILGHGTVGSTVRAALQTWGTEPTVVDIVDDDPVDVVGDATDKATLVEAGVPDADAVVIALPDDRKAVYSTLLARGCNPDVDVLVRVADKSGAGRVRRAGATYVLELPAVCGQLLAATVIDEPIENGDEQLRVVRVTDQTDLTLIDEETLVGVIHERKLRLDPDADTAVQPGDILIYTLEGDGETG